MQFIADKAVEAKGASFGEGWLYPTWVLSAIPPLFLLYESWVFHGHEYS